MHADNRTNDELLDAARAGDRGAVVLLIERHRERLEQMVRLRTLLVSPPWNGIQASDILNTTDSKVGLDPYLLGCWLREDFHVGCCC